MSNTSTNKTANKPTKSNKDKDKLRVIVGEIGRDTKTGILGRGYSNDNGKTFHVTDTMYGRLYDPNDIDGIWNGGTADRVKKEVDSATAEIPAAVSAANSAVQYAESAVAASKVNSDAIVAQSEAISEAKSAMDSATAEIQQTAANAASDAAKIRADVARVQNEVDTDKAANSASVDKLKSDIGLAQKDLDNVRDSLTKAQSAVEQNQKLINDSVAKINSDIAQSRQDIITAQQANDDLAKQLNTYSKEAQEQGKTIKTIQDNQDGFSITIADVKGDVTKVSDTVDGLSAGLKDAQGNIASVKAQADQLNATLTDHSKDIAQLTATAKELSSTLEDADGRLSKVEQTASEQSTTLSDLQGNLTQVKQTADNLVTTLKDAQGNIDQIKQDAKGTLEQLSNAQGDITALQKDVSGIKLTITDHEKNIHTLQVDSKTLKDDMADAKGNISSLQKTSTSLVSEFKDHDGRLSKVEQTATEHTSELADTKGNIDKVTQKANNLQLLLSDAQKNINNIKVDAQGLHQALTGQSNQLANLNVTLNNLDSKYSGITGDLQSKQTALNTEQQQTKDMLLRKADKSEVDNVKGTVNQVSAEQKTMTDQINQKVSSTEYQILKDKVNNLQVGGDNLISDGDASAFNATPWENTNFGKHEYYYNGTKNMFVIATSAKTELISGSNWFPIKAGQQYTLYFNGFMSNNVSSYDVWLLGKKAGADGGWSNSFNVIGGERLSPSRNCIITRTFTVPNDWNNFVAFLRFDNNGSTDGQNSVFFFNEVSLKEGNINTGYSANPNDAITLIKKNVTAIDQTNKAIKLKADQTEVDNVKNTSQQLSSRLDVMADQIKSKVTSTDVNNIVDGKGYATTSTVQSLITQKAGTINESITNLDAKYRNINGVNLVHNSGFHNVTIDELKNSGWYINDGIWINKAGGPNKNGSIVLDYRNGTQGSKEMTQTIQLEPDTDYTLSLHVLSAEMAAGKSFNAWTYIVEYDASGKTVSPYVDNGHPMANSGDRDQNTRTFHTTKNTHSGILYLRANPGTKVELEEVKLERGKVESNTAWTPAPSDNATVTQIQSITASIDGLQSNVTNLKNDTSSRITQLSNTFQSKIGDAQIAINDLKDKTLWKSTDSIDLNNAVSQQKIFVKGGSNLPPGDYWWYVQVESGYDSRIVQYAVSDRDNIHYSRQYDGGKWTAWSRGATESEITQLRDDINLRVKSGDLLSQINIQAGRTLIQSQKIYMDADSVIMGPNTRAFIPSAAIVNLDVAKLNAGTINTDRIHIGDDSVYLSVKNNYLRLDGSNTKDKYQLRLTSNDIEFADNDSSNWEYRIQHGINKYQTDEDGLDFDVYSKRGGANHTVMAVSDAGVMISPSLFFQTDGIDSSNWMGFTRNTVDGNTTVSFHTWDDNSEGFHVDCGARFMNYVYINGYARAQGWLTNSTLSKKTNIRKLDNQIALDKIRQDDQYLYEYKRNVAQGIYDPQASFIIDDVNDVAQYSVPREFIDQTGNYREPNVELAYLVAAFQALDKQVQEQNETIKKLEAKLNE